MIFTGKVAYNIDGDCVNRVEIILHLPHKMYG